MPFTWPERVAGRARVFCYVRDATTARATIAALRSIGSQSLVVWPDAPHADRVCAASAGITVIPHPVHLSDALSACDIVVNYGSPGLVTHAVLTGKPQLMIPLDVEKYLVARRVEAQGLGVMVRPDAGRHVTADGIRLALVRLLNSRDIASGSPMAPTRPTFPLARLDDLVAGLSNPKPNISRDLIISRAARVKFASDISQAIDQRLFDVHVNIFHFDPQRELALVEFGFDFG
jgi:hypothetical protein